MSLHLSERVIKACNKNNLGFICLSLNSTHITQLKYVAFFRPLKKKWRVIISVWKQTNAGKMFQHFTERLFSIKGESFGGSLETSRLTDWASGGPQKLQRFYLRTLSIYWMIKQQSIYCWRVFSSLAVISSEALCLFIVSLTSSHLCAVCKPFTTALQNLQLLFKKVQIVLNSGRRKLVCMCLQLLMEQQIVWISLIN